MEQTNGFTCDDLLSLDPRFAEVYGRIVAGLKALQQGGSVNISVRHLDQNDRRELFDDLGKRGFDATIMGAVTLRVGAGHRQ